jgi:hypothetical protein
MNIGAGVGVGFSNPREEPFFEYQESQACQNGSDVTPIINNPGGTFSSSPAGLSINSSTGVIDVSASTVGTYTVTYSIGPTTDTITILPADDSSFSYSSSSFRENASNPAPTITGLVGGVFSAPSEIIFADSGTNTNSSSGIINLSASTVGGPYTITYTTTGNCPTSSTFDLSIQVALSITYSAAAFCEDGGNTAAPTVVGDPGSGSFASSPAGLTINSSNGVINTDTSTPGDSNPYTITYTASTGETATAQVTIKNLPNIIITPNPSLSVCDGSSATLTASGGVSYLWSNSSTQAQITVSSSGTYSVTGTGSNGCQNTASAAFTVNPLPTISISASSTSICAGDSVTLTASGGTSYLWGGGQTANPLTVTPGATTTFSVTGTDSNGCQNTADQQITVTAVDTATVQYAAASYCIMPTVPGAQNVNGYYPMYTTASAANAYSNDGQSHSHYIGGTYYYMPGASAGSTPGVVLFHPPSNPYTPETDEPTVTGATGGVFSKHAGSGTLSINSTTGVINLQASDAGTYTVRYTSAGTCPVTVDNTITVKPLDQTTFAYSGTSFPKVGTASVTSAPGTSGGTYSATPGLSINSSTGEIDLANSTIGTYKIFYQTTGSSTTCANNGIIENFGVTAAALTLLDNNAAMSFNGTDQYIRATSSIVTGNNSRSFSLWYKTSSSAAQIPLSIGGPTDTTSSSQFAYCLNREDNSEKAAIFGKSNDTSAFTVPNTSDGNWHHLVVTYDQSALKVYIDGNLEATPSLPSSNYATSSGLTIGSWSDNNRYFNGSIDEVAVFNKALSLSEVGLIYDATNDNPGKAGDLFTGGLGSSLVYWNRMGDS